MQMIIESILSMSVIGSMIALLLLVATPITTKYFSETWHYHSKIMVLFFMMIPFSLLVTALEIQIPMDYLNLEETQQIFETGLFFTKPNSIVIERNSIQWVQEFVYIQIVPKLQYIWLIGVTVFGCQKLIRYIQFRNLVFKRNKMITDGHCLDILAVCKLEMNVKSTVHLSLNESIASPFLIGVFRPTIVIPDLEMNREDLRLIIMHELVHIKRKDLWYKKAALIANVLHWFNPVSYLLVNSINRLCEFSCDEMVVKRIQPNERKRYAEIILSTLDKMISIRYNLYPAFSNNKKYLKRRLVNIMNYKKINKGRLVFSAIIAIVLCGTGIIASATTNFSVADIYNQESAKVLEDANLSNQMAWPVPGRDKIISPFGWKRHPITNESKLHTGLDIYGETGEEIVAAQNGVVTVAEPIGGYGNTIIIDHGNGISTVYAHCSELLVKASEEVAANQTIGKVGSTGMTTGSQLHFEVRKDGEPQDPLEYVNP